MEHITRAGSLSGFAEQVLELGGIPEVIYERANFDSNLLKQPDNPIPYRTFLTLLCLAAAETGCAHFGLLLSRRQNLTMFGAVGLIMKQSEDVRGAWKDLINYYHIHNQGSTIELVEDKEISYLTFFINRSGETGHRQQADLAAGIGYNVMQMFCGPQWRPLRVFLSHDMPKDPLEYKRILGAPVFFDQEVTAIFFNSRDLDVKLEGTDEQLREILKQHLGLQSGNSRLQYSSNVKRVIARAIQDGDCSIELVSRYMSINKRTLQRQLQERQLTFKSLLECVRFDMATKYLRESTIPLSQISDILCYSNLSGFSRAFKRHGGASPRQWREESQRH